MDIHDSPLQEVERFIRAVEAKIEEVEKQLTSVQDPEERQYLRKEKQQLRKEKQQLRKEKQQLRKEKQQLRKKEEQLREKELILLKSKGRERGCDNTFLTSHGERSSKRRRAVEEYKPTYVEPEVMMGSSDPVLVALRWLFLLVNAGEEVDLSMLRAARIGKQKVPEEAYYPGVLAFLKSASLGQQGLHFGGQGYGNTKRSDLQGFINSQRKAPIEVKTAVSPATDVDVTGMSANAVLIKQEADYLKHGIEESDDIVRIGCLFCRMDRFWVVKYRRDTGTVQVTPKFPPAQKPNETPQQFAVMDPAFILMDLRRLNETTRVEVGLGDVLPGKPTRGFSTLVAFVEQLQAMFGLPASTVRFVGAQGDIQISDLMILAHGSKSLVMLRRSRSTVLKVCLQVAAEDEKSIHMASDGHPNVRSLLNSGTVDVGCKQAVFQFLELEGFGEPLSGKHITDLNATENMWNQAFQGLKHLHSRGVLHRDIKPDNMLVFEGSVLKINDYDVSCFSSDERASTELVGTRGYQSPSSMQPYREEDDILSLALAFYSMKLGITESSRNGRLRILRNLLHPSIFPEVMRSAVQTALEKLGLDRKEAEEDEEMLKIR